MPSGSITVTLPAAGASVYRSRRPAGTLLHKVMRENLETYLTGGDQTQASSMSMSLSMSRRHTANI